MSATLRVTFRKLRWSQLRFGEMKTRWGDFFQNDMNSLENIGSETNSPEKPRSRASEAALRAPVTTDPGGVAFEQAHASIEWPERSCAGPRARNIKILLVHVGVFFLLLPFAVGGRLVNHTSLCGGRKAARSSSHLRWLDELPIFAPSAGQSSSALRWLGAGAGGSRFLRARLNLHLVASKCDRISCLGCLGAVRKYMFPV